MTALRNIAVHMLALAVLLALPPTATARFETGNGLGAQAVTGASTARGEVGASVGLHWRKPHAVTISAGDSPYAPKAGVKGYRAVSKAEAGDIAKHGFRPKPDGRSMQDKWFSESRQGAEAFKRDSRYSDLTDVVEADVPQSVYDRSFKHPNIDGTGPGFCVACEDLPLLTPR